MKSKLLQFVIFLPILWTIPEFATCQSIQDSPYILEKENDIAVIDTLHFGSGKAIGYSFFDKVPGLNYVFRKRVLQPGAAIQYHLQRADEIYYVLSGTGEMIMNKEKFEVATGDAILTRAGSSHGLAQTGAEDLALIIVYEKH